MATANDDSITDKIASLLSSFKDGSNETACLANIMVADALIDTINETTGILNVEEYYQILSEILELGSRMIELNCNQIRKITNGWNVLHENNMLKYLPSIEGLSCKEIIKKYNEVRSQILELKFKELPGIVNTIETLQGFGLFCDKTLLEKYIEIGNQCLFINFERENITNSVEGLIYIADGVETLINNTNVENLLKSNISKLPSQNRKKISVIKNAISEKVDDEYKANICRSDHHTPFCRNCGLRSSWIKYFKKRDIYIKEADNHTSKNMWVNSVNKK